MPRGGQNRKSAEQARRSGTFQPSRHQEPVSIAPGMPVKPPGMSTDAEALWDAYVPILAEGGVLEQVDGLGLAQAFEAYVLAMRARDVVGDSPVIEDDPYNDGRIVLKKHPGVTAWKDAVGVLRGLLADYGLQPLGRTRLGDALRQPGQHGPSLPEGAPPVFQPRVVGDD